MLLCVVITSMLAVAGDCCSRLQRASVTAREDEFCMAAGLPISSRANILQRERVLGGILKCRIKLYKSGNACSSGDSAVQRCSIEPPWYFLLRHHSARPIHFFSYSFGHHCNHGINPRFQVRGASIFAVEADTRVHAY